jgi:hypothetical protein
MTDEPQDPFRDEEPYGPWHYSFRQGEMLMRGLGELPDAVRAIIARELDACRRLATPKT